MKWKWNELLKYLGIYGKKSFLPKKRKMTRWGKVADYFDWERARDEKCYKEFKQKMETEQT
jgi:hypothetical protein